MSRSRNIKPGLFRNEVLAELPVVYRYLFAGLWTYADRAGRFELRPKKIKAELFPYDNDVDVAAGMAALARLGFLHAYRIDGSTFVQIQNWDKHQSPHYKEIESVIPAMTGPSIVQLDQLVTDDRGNVDSTLIQPCADVNLNEVLIDPLIPDSGFLIPDSGFLIEDSKVAPKKPARSARKAETPIPDDFTVSERVRLWAIRKGHGDVSRFVEPFVLKCQAKGYKYIDHDAAFMGAISGDWFKNIPAARERGGDSIEDIMRRAT